MVDSGASQGEQDADFFLAVAGHELRTPVTVIGGYASTLLAHWDEIDDGERRELVGRIEQRSRALADLVEHLLLGSRAGVAATTNQAGVPFDLLGVLRGTVSGFAAVAPAHHLVLEAPDDLPQACGDRGAVEIVLRQLLDNAIKYSPDGGEVTVRARRDRDRMLVSVCDRGVGIPEGEHERVFERFYQVRRDGNPFAGDARGGGVGLGLYIVRRLLDAQGGSVRALAREGGGSCFEVSLPGQLTPPAQLTPLPPQ